MKTTNVNPTFIDDKNNSFNTEVKCENVSDNEVNLEIVEDKNDKKEQKNVNRDTWGQDIEFLMSCIAMSVGLGNVWRFPFTALENGGGAFLIPYIIILLLVGRPIYFLEMLVGQFSSRGSVKLFDLCPAMRGVGWAQFFMVFLLGTYYESICAIIVYYFVQSFRNPLPWTFCRKEWQSNCINASETNYITPVNNITNQTLHGLRSINRTISSSELYFFNEVLKEKNNINDGLGSPNWQLVLCLFISWLCVFSIISRGVNKSGKMAYFLAIFPYIIMVILLVRSFTLPGSLNGILYFIKPKWQAILNPQVWYAAVTQCFFSLSVCFGNIVMYSSYNKFDHNIYRDVNIVTGLDTCTSLLAGFTVFATLGHLAHITGSDDVSSVVKGGAGLAFISYPDTIAKFENLSRLYSIAFFLMLFVLGIGSNISMTLSTTTVIRDNFPKIKQWQCSLFIAIISFIIGITYLTPGGQFILTLVDYYGASMIALIVGILEIYTLAWIYGVNRLCKDAKFMSGFKIGFYWRWCWSIITPLIMTIILLYFLATYEPPTYHNIIYPNWAYDIGWAISTIGVIQIPIWLTVAVIRYPGYSWRDKVFGSFQPNNNWGPTNIILREKYNNEMKQTILKHSYIVFSFFKRSYALPKLCNKLK